MVTITFIARTGELYAQDDEEFLKRIMADWERRQHRVSSVKYVISGHAMVPKGAFTGDSHLPPHATGEQPPEDHVFEKATTLLLDFEKNRARKESHQETFHISEAYFHLTFRVKLYDGSQIQVYEPRKANTSARNVPPKYQPELWLQDERFFSFFFERGDYPVFFGHGIFPKARTMISPKQLLIPLDPIIYRFHAVGAIDGRDCVVLRTVPLTESASGFYEVWVDLTRDSAVLRWISYYNGHEDSRLDIQYQDTAHGWLPQSWRLTTQDNDGRITGWENLSCGEITGNPKIDGSQFHIEAAPGIIVADIPRNRDYKKGAPGEPDVDVRALAVQSVRHSRASVVALTLLAIAALATGLLIWIRRRRVAA